MIVEHRFEIIARCPVDGVFDHYLVEVRATRMVRVEDLVAAADELAKEPAYQEAITEELAARFSVEVTTTGKHLKGRVETVCIAGSVE